MELKKVRGISQKMIEKMREIGYTTVDEIATENPKKLSAKLGITEGTTTKYINLCKKVFKPVLKDAFEVHKIIEQLGHISTGSVNLDKVLSGGIVAQAMTEAAGIFGSGKTQLCFTLSVMCQLPKGQGGVNGSVLFIDTESTFRSGRVLQIAVSRGIEKIEVLSNPAESTILKNIYVLNAPTAKQLMLVVEKLGSVITDFNKNHEKPVKLIIVDSLMSPFRSDFIGREQLAERQQKLGRTLQELQRMAKAYDLAVIFTNQAVSIPTFFGRTIPAGGHVLAHRSQYRLWLRKGSGTKRIVKIIDAPEIEEAEILINLTKKGIE